MRVQLSIGVLAFALAFCVGCSGTDFSGQASGGETAKTKEKKDDKAPSKKKGGPDEGGDVPPASDLPPDDDQAKDDDKTDDKGDSDQKGNLADDADKAYQDLIESDDEVICSRGAVMNINVDSGSIHSDSHHGGGNKMAAWLSPPIEFKLNGIKGNKLVLNQYGQDDVVMLVPASTTLDTLVTRPGYKQVNVPKDTVLVYNAADGAYAAGAVDDDGTIVYKFEGGNTVTLPGGQNKQLSQIYDLAPKLTPHTDIRLSKLQKDAFYDKATRTVSFKVVLVPHGIGYVTFQAAVQPCKVN